MRKNLPGRVEIAVLVLAALAMSLPNAKAEAQFLDSVQVRADKIIAAGKLDMTLAASRPSRGSVLFTEKKNYNDPETGAPKTSFIDIGVVKSVIVDPDENWVLDLKLDSGQTRYLVFYGYDSHDKSMIFQTAPARAFAFKKALAEESGKMQLIQTGTFARITAILGRGNYEEYHGDQTGRVYAPSLDVYIKKNVRARATMSVDEYIDAALKPRGVVRIRHFGR